MSASTEKTPLSVFLVNFDWRDIFHTSFIELHEKLERDRWNADLNSFFFFSWAHTEYEVMEGRYKTVHMHSRYLERVRPLLDIRTFVTIRGVVRKYKLSPQVWSSYDFGSVPALWFAKRCFGGRIIMVVNNQAAIYSRTRKFGKIKGMYSWCMERVSARLVDHVLTINETMREYLLSIGVPKERISVFSMNTITRDQKEIEESKEGIIRAQYGISNDTKILLTVARLEAEKNYPELLEHFASLGEGYALFALGRGSMLEELEEKARELGVSDRVFFPGYVHRDEIWNYYRDADAFVLLSKAEALGVVLWEAMYLSVPVIGSDVPGILESLGVQGERGLIWKHGESGERFKELVEKALAKSDERTRMLKDAKEYVEAQLENETTINTVWDTHYSHTYEVH